MVSVSPTIVSSVVTDQAVQSRRSVGFFMPDTDTNVREVRSMYEKEILFPADRISGNLRSKPFRDTRFGRLAPEIRQMIFTNLLASPPAYGGHDFRAATESSSGQSPIQLATFVDLKGSYLAILRTCRQIHFEAFPVFYANKSYYVANAQDLMTMLGHKFYLQVKPRLFRLDTITSLCLRNIIPDQPKWRPEDIDYLISRHEFYNRESLQAERSTDLDSELLFVNFQEMKSLRKICVCISVGQEREILKFLFNIKGFGRGVIDFKDDFRWSIRSQNVSADDWNLQYAAYSCYFYRMGKNFDLLSVDDLEIQEGVLDIDSRASDLTEGDERWVEIDIGAGMYEETIQYHEEIMHHCRPYCDRPDSVPSQGSESEQETPVEEAIDLLPDDALDRTTGHLQELVEYHGDDLQSQDEWDEGSQHLQVQRNGQNDDAKTENEPAQGSSYLKWPADGQEQNIQAEFGLTAMSDALNGSSTEYTKGASIQKSQEELIDISTLFNIQEVHPPTITWSEGSVILPDDGGSLGQANMDQINNPAMVVQGRSTFDLQTQPRESTQACTKRSLKSRKKHYGDAHTQIDLVQSKNRHAKGKGGPKKARKKLFKLPAPPETPRIPLTTVALGNSSPDPENDKLSLPTTYTKLYLRAATLILALSLAYVVLSEQFEGMLSEMLTLHLAILLYFAVAAVLSEDSG